MRRLFVAIALPGEIREALADLGADRIPGLRPVPAGQRHLTLRFLGNAEPDEAADALARVPVFEGFPVAVSGVGCFGPARAPAVLWAGVDPSEELTRLREAVERELGVAGFGREEREWHPHITLGRFRRSRGEAVKAGRRGRGTALAGFLEKHADLRLPPFLVESFSLFASEPVEGGVRHVEVAVFGATGDAS